MGVVAIRQVASPPSGLGRRVREGCDDVAFPPPARGNCTFNKFMCQVRSDPRGYSVMSTVHSDYYAVGQPGIQKANAILRGPRQGRGKTRLARDFPLPPSRVDKSGTNPERICQAGGQVVGRSVGRDNSLMPKVAPP